MAKNRTVSLSRDARTGQFLLKPLGRAKAAKFSLVEGVDLTEDSARVIGRLEASGKKGAALRSSITGAFRAKK